MCPPEPKLVNASRPYLWNDDTHASVAMFNEWFLSFAPAEYIKERNSALSVISTFVDLSDSCVGIDREFLKSNPRYTSLLRMMCAPPIARDRLAGLARVQSSVVNSLEQGKLPRNHTDAIIDRILSVIFELEDSYLIPWRRERRAPTMRELDIFKAVAADRYTGNSANPVIRNQQENRQLDKIRKYLLELGYSMIEDAGMSFKEMPPHSFAFRRNVPVYKNGKDAALGYVNVTVDVIIKKKNSRLADIPLLVECKSAGDFTNTNKRRKEEATKAKQLRATYGDDMKLCLFLCGYFNSEYLGYEAANGLDWVWEHRISDFELFDV